MKPILFLSDEPENSETDVEAGYVWRFFWSAAMFVFRSPLFSFASRFTVTRKVSCRKIKFFMLPLMEEKKRCLPSKRSV